MDYVSSKVHIFIKKNWLLLTLFLLSFFLQTFPLRNAFYWDESVYLQNAEVIFSGRTNYSELDFRPPLLPLILSFFYFFKHSLLTAQIVNGFLSSINVIAIYLLSKELFNKKTALLSSFFFTFLAFSIEFSNMILTGNSALGIFTLGSYFLLKYFRKRKISFLFFGNLLVSLSVLMRFTNAILILVFVFFLFIVKIGKVYDLKFRLKTFFTSAILVFLFMLPYFIFSKLKFDSFFYTFFRGNQIIEWSYSSGKWFYFTQVPLFTIISLIFLLGISVFIWLKKKRNFKKKSFSFGLDINWFFVFESC